MAQRTTSPAEDAAEDRVDVGEVVVEVEQGLELRGLERLGDVGIGLQERQELALAFPYRHGVALHEAVGVLARDALLGEGEQHALGVDEAAEAVEVPAHVLGVDDELLDHAGHACEREVEGDGGVGADDALDRGVGDVALVPERDVLHRRQAVAAHEAGEAGEVLAQHRVALVRHGRGALLAGREEFLGLAGPRCAAGGGSRWRAARARRRRRRAWRSTRRGGRAG